MAVLQNIKLFKIASEINIGRETIVEFLQSKGFSIENKPTANLTPEMVDAVNDKFKKEKKAIEKQREKLEKHKKIKKSPDDKSPDDLKDNIESDNKQFSLSFEDNESNEIISSDIDVEQKIPDLVPDSTKDTIISAEIPTTPKDFSFQVGQVIDIPGIKKTKVLELPKIKEPDTDKIQAKEASTDKTVDKVDIKKEDIIIESPNIPATITEVITEPNVSSNDKQKFHDEKIVATKTELPKKEEAKQKQTIDRIEPARYSKKENIKIDSVATAPEEEINGNKIETQDIPAIIDDANINKVASDSEDQDLKKGKKKKKRKRMIEIDYQVGEAPKLKGLTIVGKIDLQKEKVVKKDKKVVRKKEVDEEEDTVGAKSKPNKLKKRSKIKGKPLEQLKEKLPDKKKKKKKTIRESISEEEVEQAIKQTLSGMEEGTHLHQRSKMRQKKRLEREEKEHQKIEAEKIESAILHLTEFVTVNNIANIMEVSPNEIILKCLKLGLMVNINQRLDKDTITLIADDYGYQVEFHDEKAIQTFDFEEEEDQELEPRPPIVTIMGHVDHGKTSLLDFIRNSNIVAGEAGGITQHIGAYSVQLPNEKRITFLDTPGHEAFTAMRARGAQATDIVVLVVAADDSVMPQTIEAISHAKAANVPIVVAINKIDKPDSNSDRIRQQLTDYGVLVEEWGGKYQAVEISAKKGINIELLLEKILLEAEFLEIKAKRNRKARCVVIEANMDKGLGPVSTVIVQKGILNIGDSFVAGVYSGRVRAMFDERDRKVETATPATPVKVVGFEGLPEAGDILVVTETEFEARNIATERQQLKREQEFRQIRHITLDDISREIQLGGVKELNLIIKADVSGSVEALSDSLMRLSTDEVRVIILHKGVGSISESDVMLAIASRAVIIGFNISTSSKARIHAEKESVDIRLYNIIYDCINEVKLAIEGLLSPELREDVVANVEIRKIFKISKVGVIAGCYVLSGKISRNDKIRVLRDGLPVFTGSLHSLKRGKDDVKEVDTGYECGIVLEGYHDVEVSDIIEAYKVLEIKRTLSD